MTKVVVGLDFTCARHEDGSVSCWGANRRQQLGLADRSTHPSPTRVPDLDDVIDISADMQRTCVLRKGSTVECWGPIDPAKPDVPRATVPFHDAVAISGRCARTTKQVECLADDGGIVAIPGTEGATTMAASKDEGCVVQAKGTVSCWHGPREVAVIPGVFEAVEVGLADELACARSKAGAVTCSEWARPREANIDPAPTPPPARVPVPVRPTLVPKLAKAKLLAVGFGRACAATETGVSCWDRYSRTEGAEPVPSLGVVSLLAAGRHSCASRGGGDLVCWGDGTGGALGNGWTHAQTTPVRVPGIDGAVEIAASYSFTGARKDEGTMACWGNLYPNNQPDELAHAQPRIIPGMVDIQHLARTEVVMGIDGQGRLWNAVDPSAPMKLPKVTQVVDKCAIATDGRVLCWGSLRPRNTVSLDDAGVAIPGIDDAVQVSVGGSQACVRKRSGEITCFREDNLPYEPWSITDAVDVTAGLSATCVVRRDRTVWCMGDGRVPGAGKKVPPTRIAGLTGVATVAMGADFACALGVDGTVACWGDNRGGQLGDGTTTERTTPRPVAGLEGVRQLTAGSSFACALLQDGTVRCWGDTREGAVGTYVTSAVQEPAPVAWP